MTQIEGSSGFGLLLAGFLLGVLLTAVIIIIVNPGPLYIDCGCGAQSAMARQCFESSYLGPQTVESGTAYNLRGILMKSEEIRNQLITRPDDQVLDYIQYQHQASKVRQDQCRDNPALSA